ncbi:hypothetical protein PSHT_15998 [Puccinia striiformis]|uniref:Uncharacterized protein n=2 Tax=Puccinia striiformis TaxID=27350 RepID=A0A2S4UC12_9BASI|nr:hypothetical protein PSHT_15998 [Puccinia striiformis]POV98830.1 hypothetical protein PSTT_14171 [Puccinia striiformis]
MCIQNTPKISDMTEKLLYIGKFISKFGLDPKHYTAFFCNKNAKIVSNLRIWGAEIGWRSTQDVLHCIKGLVCKTTDGKSRWKDYILPEACLSLYDL